MTNIYNLVFKEKTESNMEAYGVHFPFSTLKKAAYEAEEEANPLEWTRPRSSSIGVASLIFKGRTVN